MARFVLPGFLVAASALALAACNGQSTKQSAAVTGDVSLKNASVEQVAEQVKAAGGVKLQPGQWETTVETLEIDLPIPEGPVRDQVVKQMKSQRSTVSNCITKEQAENPSAGVFAGTQGKCAYKEFKMGGGKIHGVIECQNPAPTGSTATKVTTSGAYSGTTFDMVNRVDASGPNNMDMHIKAHVTGKRLGECKA